MSNNPYPTAADRRREADAWHRDGDDLITLRQLRRVLVEAIGRVECIDELRHPERCWSRSELLEVLRGELVNIDGTRAMIVNGPAVLMEDA